MFKKIFFSTHYKDGMKLVQLPARVCSKIATCTDKFMTNITKSQTKGEGIILNLSDYVEKGYQVKKVRVLLQSPHKIINCIHNKGHLTIYVKEHTYM